MRSETYLGAESRSVIARDVTKLFLNSLTIVLNGYLSTCVRYNDKNLKASYVDVFHAFILRYTLLSMILEYFNNRFDKTSHLFYFKIVVTVHFLYVRLIY